MQRTRLYLRAAILASILSLAAAPMVAAAPPSGKISAPLHSRVIAPSGARIASIPATAYWTAPAIGSVNMLGAINLPLASNGTVTVLNPWISSTAGGVRCTATSWNSAGTVLTITYTVNSTTVHVTVQPIVTGTGIRAAISADQPVITSVEISGWSSSLSVQSISVPYYTSQVWYSPAVASYLNTWFDWHGSNATTFNGTYANYAPKTDGTLNLLNETLVVAASPNIDLVFPATGNPVSPYIGVLSQQIFFDIWGGSFLQIQDGLADLGDYGIDNCSVVIHDWQNAGYDNALPGTFPAQPSLGGNAGLQDAIAQGNANGCYTGVHENYVDYYPNYPNFNTAAVALNSNGSQMLSWKNQQTGIQSFSTKPTWMVANAQTQSPQIHSALGTTAGYLDVSSAAPISSHGDMTASSAGAGTLAAWMQGNESLWSYERQAHNGPVFGEGLNHWIYSGYLDGVEAQLGAGNFPSNSDASLPLFVDFDLFTIHPNQVNQGMGYFERWTSTGTGTMTTTQLDAYRTQEIAFGHAAFLGSALWNDVSHAFVEANLVPPVSASYGPALASHVYYTVNSQWVSTSVAALTQSFKQVQVVYNNGLQVVANSAPTQLYFGNYILPQYGWLAQGAGVLAYTANCGNVICDYAQTPTSYFANARNQSDAQIGFNYVAPTVAQVSMASPQHISITSQWQVYRTPGTQITYRMFMHFVNDSQANSSSEGIVFTGDHFPSPSTTTWEAGQKITEVPYIVKIPSGVADGTYSIRVGLFDPATDLRLPMLGTLDAQGRTILGHVTISGGGTKLTFTAQPPVTQANDPRLNVAGTVVNFGSIQTDGMLSITQQNGNWVLRPYPRYRNFTVLINSANIPMPSVVNAVGDTNTTVLPVSQGTYWQLPLNNSSTYTWPIN